MLQTPFFPVLACLLLLVAAPFTEADDRALKPVGKAGHINVVGQGFVTNFVTFSDFKLTKNELTCTAVWRQGPPNAIWFDFYDADNVRVAGQQVSPSDLVKFEKAKLRFALKKPDEIKTLKITRDYER
jgi:hypothetical protein